MSGDQHPTAEEVRTILDVGKTKPAGWYAEKFLRPFSMPLIMLCIRMKWSANIVTLVHMIVGVVAGVFIAIGQIWTLLLGAILWQVWFLLDLVDGEIARYYKSQNVTGIYLDVISHHLLFPYFFISYGLYHYLHLHNHIVLVLALWCGLCVLITRTVRESIYTAVSMQLERDKVGIYPSQNSDMKVETNNSNDIKKHGNLWYLANLLYTVNSFPSIMNLFLLASLLSLISLGLSLEVVRYMLYAYSLSLFVISVRSILAHISRKKPDELYVSIRSGGVK